MTDAQWREQARFRALERNFQRMERREEEILATESAIYADIYSQYERRINTYGCLNGSLV